MLDSAIIVLAAILLQVWFVSTAYKKLDRRQDRVEEQYWCLQQVSDAYTRVIDRKKEIIQAFDDRAEAMNHRITLIQEKQKELEECLERLEIRRDVTESQQDREIASVSTLARWNAEKIGELEDKLIIFASRDEPEPVITIGETVVKVVKEEWIDDENNSTQEAD